MAKNREKNEEMSYHDRIANYQIVSQHREGNVTVTKLRTYNGATVICRIPDHTAEEKKEIGARIAEQMTRIVHPELDLSKCARIEVVI